jgi:hypothetical protein
MFIFITVLIPVVFLTVKLTVCFPALLKILVAMTAFLELILSLKSNSQKFAFIPSVFLSVISLSVV